VATRGAEESRVRIWDVAAGTQRREFGGLSAGGRLLGLGRPRLSLSPDNRTLAVNFDHGTVHLLDVTNYWELRVLGEPKVGRVVGGGGGPVQRGLQCLGVAFAPDGRSLAASYRDLTVRVWEIASGWERRSCRYRDGVRLLTRRHAASHRRHGPLHCPITREGPVNPPEESALHRANCATDPIGGDLFNPWNIKNTLQIAALIQ
jgi:WD40 repeat protein